METNTYTGTITAKEVKATYRNIKLDIGNNRTVTLNTKENDFWESQKIGDTATYAYNESIIPNRTGENGEPMKMKWIVLDNQYPKTALPALPGLQPAGTNAQLDRIEAKLDKLLETTTTRAGSEAPLPEELDINNLPF